MKKIRVFFAILTVFLIGGGTLWQGYVVPSLREIITLSKNFDLQDISHSNLEDIATQIDGLSNNFFSTELKNTLREASQIQDRIQEIKEIPDPLNNLDLVLAELFSVNKKVFSMVRNVETKLQLVPKWLLSEEQQQQLEKLQYLVQRVRDSLEDIQQFRATLGNLYQTESRLVVLLQNQNEPRSTGGFMGSLVVMDFSSDETFTWELLDMYSLDRKVPDEYKEGAPEWFHGLSANISLRDANFWPDFPTSAKKIREFFGFAGEKQPDVIVAVNLNLVREVLGLTGAVRLDKWDLEMNDFNFDMVLQFLVEGKIMGRFNVKDPVKMAATEIFSPNNLERVHTNDLLEFDWEDFIRRGNIQAYATNKNLQKLFDQWGIAGRIEKDKEADNFLQFDFVSVGANKSEKFLWTRVNHNSFIMANGDVKNSLKIIRNHTLQPNQIQNILRTNTWSENIRDLLNEELLWKLGGGQNRTMIRVMVPRDVVLNDFGNPSGEVRLEKLDEKFALLEVPAFVLPGEKLEINIDYTTKLKRGSLSWRPYNLQLATSPGKQRAQIVTTISTPPTGNFSAETLNIGRPVDLIGQNFRAVVEFGG